MEERPVETDDPAQRKLLEDGDFGEFIAGPAAQDAFTYGGEAGYLRYVYDEARRRVDRNKAQPSQTVIIGRHDPGSEWPDVSYTSVEAEEKRPTAPGEKSNDPPAPPAPPITAESQDQGTLDRRPQPTDEADKAPVPEPIGPDRQLPPADTKLPAKGNGTGDDTPDDQPPAPDAKADLPPEIVAAREDLRTKREAYAAITATRRSSGRAALLEGSRFAQLARKFLLNPYDYHQAVKERERSEQARTEYKQALDNYMSLVSGDETRKVRTKLGHMVLFERNVLRHQQLQTYSGHGHNGQPELTSRDRQRLNFARRWLEDAHLPQKRWGTLLFLGGAAVGVAAAFVTGPFSGPALIIGTGVSAAAGRGLGGRAARQANKYWPGTEQGNAQIWNRVTEALRDDFGYNRGMKKGDLPVQHEAIKAADPTVTHEQLTTVAARGNAVRRRNARIGGAVLAGGGFLIGDVVTSAFMVANASTAPTSNILPKPTATPAPTHTPPPPTTTPTPNTVPTPPAGLAHEFPWDAATQYNVAHHLSTSPSSVWNTLHNAAAQFNQAHGTNFDYVLQPNGKFWLENGTHQITQAQLASFNNFLWNLVHH